MLPVTNHSVNKHQSSLSCEELPKFLQQDTSQILLSFLNCSYPVSGAGRVNWSITNVSQYAISQDFRETSKSYYSHFTGGNTETLWFTFIPVAPRFKFSAHQGDYVAPCYLSIIWCWICTASLKKIARIALQGLFHQLMMSVPWYLVCEQPWPCKGSPEAHGTELAILL